MRKRFIPLPGGAPHFVSVGPKILILRWIKRRNPVFLDRIYVIPIQSYEKPCRLKEGEGAFAGRPVPALPAPFRTRKRRRPE